MKPSKKIIISSIAITFGLVLTFAFQNCSPNKFSTNALNSGFKNMSSTNGLISLTEFNQSGNSSCFTVGGSQCPSDQPEKFEWQIKFCSPIGCVGAGVGGGTFSHIPKPNEVCDAANARRVVTVQVIAGAASKDYLVGCRSTKMSNDEFLNMMNQNSMATYTFNQAVAGGGTATATTTPAPAPAPVAAPVTAAPASGTGGGGFVTGPGGGNYQPAPVTYNWYVPMMNGPMQFNAYSIPVGCTASNVGIVVSIKDAAIADRRVMCLASNNTGMISGIVSATPAYLYDGVNGALVTRGTNNNNNTGACSANQGQACRVEGKDAPANSEYQYRSVWCSYTQAPYYQTGVAGSYPHASGGGVETQPTALWSVTCKYSKPGTYNCQGHCVAN